MKNSWVEVSKEELEDVTFSFQKDKNPSHDGWSIEFVQGIYDMLEDKILDVVEESRLFGKVMSTFAITAKVFLTLLGEHQVSYPLNDVSWTYGWLSLDGCLTLVGVITQHP